MSAPGASWFDRCAGPLRPRLEELMQRAVGEPWSSTSPQATRIRAMVQLLAALLALILVSLLISAVGRYGSVLFLPIIGWLLSQVFTIAWGASPAQFSALLRTAAGWRKLALAASGAAAVLSLALAVWAIVRSLLA